RRDESRRLDVPLDDRLDEADAAVVTHGSDFVAAEAGRERVDVVEGSISGFVCAACHPSRLAERTAGHDELTATGDRDASESAGEENDRESPLHDETVGHGHCATLERTS